MAAKKGMHHAHMKKAEHHASKAAMHAEKAMEHAGKATMGGADSGKMGPKGGYNKEVTLKGANKGGPKHSKAGAKA